MSIKNKRLIGPFQIVANPVADGVLETIKFASIKNGRSLDLGQAMVESWSKDSVRDGRASRVILD